MAEKGVWWSLQPFLDDRPSAFPEGSPNRVKQLEMFSGTDTAYLGQEIQDQDGMGNRYALQRGGRGKTRRNTCQDGSLVYAS